MTKEEILDKNVSIDANDLVYYKSGILDAMQEYADQQTKELQERVEELEKLHTLGLQALVESNNEKAQLKARVEELNASLLDVATKSAEKVVELQAKVEELEKVISGLENKNEAQASRLNNLLNTDEGKLQAKIDELEKANEWISVDKKTPYTYLSGTWDGLMSDEILVKDDKGIINVARCYTGIMDGHSFVDFYDNRDFELKNIIQWKKITN